MSLPLTYAGGSAEGTSAALDLKFASTLSLTSSSGITPSYSRASTGTYFNSSGVLTSAAINAPRFDHTYNGTSWISRGLLVEEQRANLFFSSEDFGNSYWTKTGSTVSTNQVVAPDGTVTADKISEDTSTNKHRAYRILAGISVSTTYTISVFAKKAERSWLALNWADDVGDRYTYFDLTNGVVGDVRPSATASIQNVGNGWFRCSVTRTLSNPDTNFDFGPTTGNATIPNYAGTSGSGIYIWGAQLEAGAFPTSYIPTTSASATRSADVCQITGSDFSSFWNASEGSFAVEYDKVGNKTGASVTTVVFGTSNSNSTPYEVYYEDYNGTEYYRDFNGSSQFQIATSPSAAPNTTVRIAGCYKANDVAVSRNGNAVLTDTSVTLFGSQTTLTIGDITAGQWPVNGHIARLRYFNKRLTDKQLEDLCRPEDQLKLDLKFSENLSLTPVVGPTPSFSRASTGTYFNSSGVLTSAAINAPRFDHTYDGTSWISKGLLIEEQRTNTALYSSDIGNAYWSGTSSKTANFGISPDGTQNAARITGGGYFQSGGISKLGAQTFSFWAKTISGNSESINAFLDGGATTTTLTITGSWVRYSVTQTFGSTNTGTIGIYPLSASILFYGPQLESGAFATSYIPTTTTSVVRSADVCQITGADFSGFYNQSEGSIVLEYSLTSTNGNPTVNFLRIADAPPGNQSWETGIRLSTNSYFADVYNILSGGYQAQLSGTFTGSLAGKTAFAARANDFAASFNGGTVATDTSGVMPVNIANMYIYANNNHIARLRYYAIRLPNRLLIAKSQ